MKNLLISLLLLTSATSFSQLRLQMSPSASVDWSYRYLVSDVDSFGVNGLIMDGRNHREKYAPRPTVGFDFGLISKTGFSYGTGINFSLKGYRSKDTVLLSLSSGVGTYGLYHSQSYDMYFDIPIVVGYNIELSDRHFLKLQLGYINNIYLVSFGFSRLKTIGEDSWTRSSGSTAELDRYASQGMAGVYFYCYPMNWQGAVEIGPQFKYGILPIKDAPILERAYSIGLHAAILF
jgi:hypothetical protein